MASYRHQSHEAGPEAEPHRAAPPRSDEARLRGELRRVTVERDRLRAILREDELPTTLRRWACEIESLAATERAERREAAAARLAARLRQMAVSLAAQVPPAGQGSDDEAELDDDDEPF